MSTTQRAHDPAKSFEYTVDGSSQETSSKELTPRAIVTNAGLNANERYLIELKGDGKQVSFKDLMDAPIRMHEHQEFITASLGPTPVS